MKASPHFEEACHPTAQSRATACRLCDSAKNLKKCALTRAIAADDSKNFSFLNFEAHVLQCPELLDFVPLNDLPPMGKVDSFAHKVLCFSRQHFTKGLVLLIFAMSNQIAL